MTIYYVMQDNTIWGCGEPGCCGEYEERIEESFVDCTCEQVEPDVKPDMKLHLQSCLGGGTVLRWRLARPLEAIAFNAGKDEGFQEGSDWGIEWQKKKQRNKSE